MTNIVNLTVMVLCGVNLLILDFQYRVLIGTFNFDLQLDLYWFFLKTSS